LNVEWVVIVAGMCRHRRCGSWRPTPGPGLGSADSNSIQCWVSACLIVAVAWMAVPFLALGQPNLAENPRIELDRQLPAGARVFIAPAEDGFEAWLAAALFRKKVPLVIVSRRDKAQYEISAVANSEQAGWARILFVDSTSSENAAIKITGLDTGEIVFADAVHKGHAPSGKRSAAEACAKHLKKKFCCLPLFAQQGIPAGSSVFVAPMGGFETYFTAALRSRKLPLQLVDDREKAAFEISGAAESHELSTAKKIATLRWQSREEASVVVTDLKAGVVVFAYSAFSARALRGKRTTAEDCARRLKEVIRGR